MSQELNPPTLDLVRWTFTSNPEHSTAIEEYLVDLGLDVLVYEDCKFLVTWDEPDRELEEVITELWEINGAPFEVIQEDFHRLGLNVLHHVEDEETEAA